MEKILIAYFSHAGQNYSHGGIKNLPVGNTEVVAKKLHAMIPNDLFYIDTVQKYPDDHICTHCGRCVEVCPAGL